MVAEWIISSSVLIALVVTLRLLFRGKLTPCFQYALWGLVLIRLLVPVSFGVSPVSVMNAVPNTVSKAVLPARESAFPHAVPEGATPEPPSPGAPERTSTRANSQDGVVNAYTGAISWRFVAKVVWLTGLAAVGLFLLITNLRFSARLKGDREMTGISGYPLPVYVSSLVETPCMFGLFRPAIYVTQEVRRDETLLRHVLEHEATHYYHGDHIWAVLRGVCLALHWYNPFVWSAASLSMQDAELACDESTIERIGDESRVDYGRSLIAMTSKKRITAALLRTATTMTGSENSIKERIALIANKRKMAPYTFILVASIAVLAACGAFTQANDALPDVPPAGASSTGRGTEIYTIPLDNVPFYGPHGIRTEPPVDGSDIVEIFAEAESAGVKMMFYRARNADIWGAFQKADGSIHQFIQAYNSEEQWGYETGFSVELFEDLFGRDGFVMGCPFGSSYLAYDYYFLNKGGDVELLASCVNNHSVVDLDGKGGSELLHFSHVNAALSPYFYFQREGRLFQVDVVSRLYDTFLGWSGIWSEGSVSQDDGGPYLTLSFRLDETEAEYSCKVRYTGDALSVEVPKAAIPPDGVIWSVQQEDYEVGLRNQGDKTDILLRRGEVLTVLDSLPSNANTGWRYSLRPFDAIPELSGFVLGNLAGYGWGDFHYYAVRGNSAVCFAQSFGAGITDIVKDLNGDGASELICNVTYGADGVTDALVYRVKDGIPQVASVTDAVLNIPEGKHLARPASAVYDANTGSVTLEYLIAGEDDFRVETAPIVYDSLRFENFAP